MTRTCTRPVPRDTRTPRLISARDLLTMRHKLAMWRVYVASKGW